MKIPASEITTAFHFKYEFRVDEVAKVAKVNHNKIYSTFNGVIGGAAKLPICWMIAFSKQQQNGTHGIIWLGEKLIV